MNALFTDGALCCAAQKLSVGLAKTLPEVEEIENSGTFRTDFFRQCRKRRVLRTVLPRVAAISLTVLLSAAVILAASPVARAAVSRWFVAFTQQATVYHIAPADGGAEDCAAPVPPVGYTLSGDYTGDGGVRVVRFTSPRGDLLFESVPLTGAASITAELRGDDTAGIILANGERPTGEPGAPVGYSVAETFVHGLSARMYTFPAPSAGGADARPCWLLLYRSGEEASFHSVALSPGASALIWVDEVENRLFLVTGGAAEEDLLATAESLYRSERS